MNLEVRPENLSLTKEIMASCPVFTFLIWNAKSGVGNWRLRASCLRPQEKLVVTGGGTKDASCSKLRDLQTSRTCWILGRKFVQLSLIHLHLANPTLACYYNNGNTIFFNCLFHIPFTLKLSCGSIFIIFSTKKLCCFLQYLLMGHDCWRGRPLLRTCTPPFAKFSRKERYYSNVLAATEVLGQSPAKHEQFRLCWAQ